MYAPRGWKVVSGGTYAEYYGNGQLLTKSHPIVSGGRPIERMAASKDHVKSDPGQVETYAIAMWDTKDEWDVIVRSSTSGTESYLPATVALPTDVVVVGGEANVLYRDPGFMLVESYPSGSMWRASSKDHMVRHPKS